MNDYIYAHIRSSIDTKERLLKSKQCISTIEVFATAWLKCLRGGGKLIFAGNGGSFADAQHLSAELTSRFMFDRAPLASLVLGANNSAISAIGNDYGYDQVFSRELTGLAQPADVFIPISTSGNSPNIFLATQQANKIGLVTTALTGETGGKLASICDCLCIPSKNTAQIQECHIMVGHIICGIVEEVYFKG